MKNKAHSVNSHNTTPPRHILPQIFKLDLNHQQQLFRHDGSGDALTYALEYDSDELAAFELTDSWKQYAISARIGAYRDLSLIHAAKKGNINTIRLLLGWGANIELCDKNKDTALHWAAWRGHVDAVTYLLENSALLNARGFQNSTPLHCAVQRGKDDIVKLLIKNNADLNARNNNGQNALDLAIAERPRLIKPILMHLATLPVDQQAECLAQVPDGPYDNVYSYIIGTPHLFHYFLYKKITNQDNIQHKLSEMRFNEHVLQIYEQYQLMKEKSQSNSEYITATSVAKTLLTECIKAKIELYLGDNPADEKIRSFKESCARAIETARPVLTKYRELWKAIATFLLVLVTLPVSLPLYCAGFFSFKTKSEQLIDGLQAGINKPQVVI